jgi:DNA-cytosine methyltransferase
MRVLSLFDGVSCGQLALHRAGIKVETYYASEIDKHTIAITKYNFPNTIHLGDVCELTEQKLPKNIDLLIGGSPCQSFSNLGSRNGFDGKSKLFWEYVRILELTKPKYFLLENVKMKNEWRDIITNAVGVEPVMINSNLVSAQNRSRYYWTNIPNITQPTDKGIILKDVLETNVDPKYFHTDKIFKYMFKNQRRISEIVNYSDKKCKCIVANFSKGQPSNVLVEPFVFRETRTQEAKLLRKKYREQHGIDYVPRSDKELEPRQDGKSNTVTTSQGKNEILVDKQTIYRKFTPVECERLQTMPDDWTRYGIDANKKLEISTTQRYKAIGNAWTVDVVVHIFKGLK